MTNRNPIKQVFVTFPRSGEVTREQLGEAVMQLNPQYYKCVRETHEDGDPHLHMLLQLKQPKTKAFILKVFKEKYPDNNKSIDVKPVRSLSKTMEYIKKEDTNPLEYGEFIQPRNPQRNRLNKFAHELGYTNIEALATHHKELVDVKSQQVAKILKFYYTFISNYDVNSIPWETRTKIHNLQKDPIYLISKDDITFLMKDMNIKP